MYIDESGRPTPDQMTFAASAIYCLPNYRECAHNILGRTLEQLKDFLETETGKRPDELHFSEGSKRYAAGLCEILTSQSHHDYSIRGPGVLWERDRIKNSHAIFTPAIEYFKDIPRPDFGNHLRAKAIGMLLRPLIIYDGESDMHVDVILDDDIWMKSIDIIKKQLGQINNHVRFNYSCQKSNKIPGLQIADLCAGVVRSYHDKGVCEDAYHNIAQHILHRLTANTAQTQL
ncbi:MAG: DUF3800 domain-containing protein [Euryarchaeota archaeon]|nr:DUF3800 domain-containing protein [Euryarchaeota archaeon]